MISEIQKKIDILIRIRNQEINNPTILEGVKIDYFKIEKSKSTHLFIEIIKRHCRSTN